METADEETEPKGSNGNCFLCWIKLEATESEESPRLPYNSPRDNHPHPIQYLSSYLKLRGIYESGYDDRLIRFCETCLPIKEIFVELYRQLHQIELEMANCLQRIDWKLAKSEEENWTIDHSPNEQVDFMTELKQEIRQKCCEKLCSLLSTQEENAEWACSTTTTPPSTTLDPSVSSMKVKTEPSEDGYEDHDMDPNPNTSASQEEYAGELWSEDIDETNYQNPGAISIKTEIPDLSSNMILPDDAPMDFMNELMQPSTSSADYISSPMTPES